MLLFSFSLYRPLAVLKCHQKLREEANLKSFSSSSSSSSLFSCNHGLLVRECPEEKVLPHHALQGRAPHLPSAAAAGHPPHRPEEADLLFLRQDPALVLGIHRMGHQAVQVHAVHRGVRRWASEEVVGLVVGVDPVEEAGIRSGHRDERGGNGHARVAQQGELAAHLPQGAFGDQEAHAIQLPPYHTGI